MKTRSLLVRSFAAITLTFALTAGQLGAQVATFSDATNDIAPSIATAGGTLDIVKMEVVDTATDVQFTMTVNGNINATTGGVDWGKFMIGIANQKTPGTTTGNGWGRPINLNAGVTNGVTNGMTHWIGSWVDGGGGGELFAYGTTNWSSLGALAGYVITPGTQSTITYTVSKESLGVTNGDTIIFDAYSSGGGGGDSAIDALSNPTNSVTDWGGPYTSSATNTTPIVGLGQTRSYTLANTALNSTQNITFSVDMTAQIAAGNFVPNSDIVSVDWGAEFVLFQDLADPEGDGTYTGTATITAPANTPVAYRFTIVPADESEPLIPETVSRSFLMPNSALTIPTVFFNNVAAYRNVTFTVDMSVQQTLLNFDPATQTVEVRGDFNNWAGTTLTAQSGGLYSGTILVGGTPGQDQNYKFYTAGPGASGYESGSNRTFTFAVNPEGAPDPALVLPTVFFSNLDTAPDFRAVTFSVNMSYQISQGNFNPATGVVEVRGPFNNWTGTQLTAQGGGIYSKAIAILDAPGSTVNYKFWATGLEWETVPDRSFVCGPFGVAQTLPTVFFNNNSGQTRQVKFSVDMSVQQALGLFDPTTGVVELRGIGGFGPAQAQPLAREGETLVYSGTFTVGGDGGTDFSYKFYSPGVVFYTATDPTNTGFEIINQTDAFQNRSVTLDANGAPMELDTVFFSNQLFYIVGSAPTPFSTTQGTASAAQSVTINGKGLSANIVAVAPTGFEVSTDDSTYGPTADISPTAGAVTGSNNLFVRIAASAAAGSRAGNVTLTSTGGQPLSIAVSGTVSDPANIVTASDNAGNYAAGWTNGANGGTGFGAWNITTSTNTNAFAGAFIGDPAFAGITNFSPEAFGLYANPNGSGAFVDVSRAFPVLQVGQTFSFQWAVNFDSDGGNKGFNVFGGGQQVVNVNQGSFPGDIVVNIGTNSINTSNTITYGTNPMTWSFTRTAADNLQVTATGRDGTTNIAFSTNVAITTGPDTAAWYAADMGAGDQRQPFFNNLQISGPPLVTNQVTFSVDMNAQIDAQTFDPATGVVEVRGEFNGFAGGDVLTPVGDGVYRGTFAISGTTGTPVFYKFWATGLDYEGGSNRSFTLGTAGEEQNLLTVPFTGGLPLETRDVNFSVDMSVQIALGNFIPAGGVVEVRGPFNGWNGTALTAQGAGIYSGTVSVPGAAGETEQYKFWATGLDYEVVDPNDPFVNRTFVLGPSGDLQILDTVFFSNQTSAGETFANWSGGQPLTPALELEYAIGGASAPGAGDGVPSVTTLTPSTLSITAVVRTNDPTLTVNGQSLINLAVGPWTTNNVTVTVVDPQPDNVPAGCEVQTFSTPRGTDGRNFLRLQTTLPAQP